jgi:hypothetical protein
MARAMHDRKLQRALMQSFKPENYFAVREALIKAGRGDLIGSGCDCLIPAEPPKAALAARRNPSNHDYYHAVPNPTTNRGYRPGRVTQKRRSRPANEATT